MIYVIHCVHVYAEIPHVQSMVTKRGLTNRTNIHNPYVKTSFKTQRGRIPIDPAILAAIGHCFIAMRADTLGLT